MSTLENPAKTQISEIPQEVKRAVRGLDNPVRWKIVEILRANPELSYTQLMESLDIKKGRLTYHLNQLLKGAILQNFSKDGLETQYDSFYAVTHFGESLINSLMEPLQPALTTITDAFTTLLSPHLSVSVLISASYLRPSFVRTVIASQKVSPTFIEQLDARVKDVNPNKTIYTGSAGGQFYRDLVANLLPNPDSNIFDLSKPSVQQ